jgi:hypothetical protein
LHNALTAFVAFVGLSQWQWQEFGFLRLEAHRSALTGSRLHQQETHGERQQLRRECRCGTISTSASSVPWTRQPLRTILMPTREPAVA